MKLVETRLLRPRNGHGSAPVTQIELFFDLVFVFAVTQLSATLRSHLHPLGTAHAVILFAAIWWSWISTSWITNWLDPDQRPVRLMLIFLMLAGLAMSISLPYAFDQHPLVFAGAYVVFQMSRSLFMLFATRGHDHANYRNFLRITCWFGCSAPFWIAGALVPIAPRLILWLLALVMDIGAPALGFYTPGLGHSSTSEWQLDSFHLAERCGGFILIALGESITVTGGTFFELQWSVENGAAFLAAFLGVVGLWWIYFDTAAERLSQAFAQADDTGRVARAAYTYLHALLVAGIIVVAVADQLVLEQPMAEANFIASLVTIGGPALYLAGNGAFRRHLAPRFPPSHIYGLAALAALALASPFIPLLALALLTTGIILGVAIIGSVLYHRQMAHP